MGPIEEHQLRLGGLVARLISVCAFSDFHFGKLFIAMLGPQAAPAFSIYDAFAWSHPKTIALKAVAETVLNKDDFTIFLGILKLFSQDQKQRHKFAHWLWAYCPTLPDHIVLVDPIKLLRYQAALAQVNMVNMPSGSATPVEIKMNEDTRQWLTNCECYSRDEMLRIIAQFTDTLILIDAFRQILTLVPKEPAAWPRARLISHPRLARAILHVEDQPEPVASQTPPSEHPAQPE